MGEVVIAHGSSENRSAEEDGVEEFVTNLVVDADKSGLCDEVALLESDWSFDCDDMLVYFVPQLSRKFEKATSLVMQWLFR